MTLTKVILAAGLLVGLIVLVRVMLRPHREPASRISWMAVILALPLLGVIAYILFGEVNIGRKRAAKLRAIESRMPSAGPGTAEDAANLRAEIPDRYEYLFRVGRSISGFEPIAGNAARLLTDSNAAIGNRCAFPTIAAALRSINLSFGQRFC